MTLALVLFSVALRYTLAHQLRADLDASLLNQTVGFDEYLNLEDQYPGMRVPLEIEEFSRSMPWDHLLAVYDSQGKAVYVSREGFDPVGDTHERTLGKTWRMHFHRHPYLAAVREARLKEGTFRVYLAISSQPIEHMLERLTALLLLILPAFVLCSALGGYWLSRRALRPVQSITEKARFIGVNNLSERLAVPETRDEIQQMAETWNDMLGRLEGAVAKISQFTADASHELRTPIAIVRFAAERALRRKRTEAEYKETLQQIQSESERMTALVEDLLYLARADANALAERRQAVDFREIVKATCSDFEPLAAEAGIALTQALDDLGPVMGNETGLRRLLRILLDNAIKYTPRGGMVSVRLAHKDGRAMLTVSDTGIGIPEEAQRHIFERFFRVDPSRSKESGGFGLGLSIAQTIANQHGSSIEMQSRDGGGSIFSVAFEEAYYPAGSASLEEAGKIH